jgi:hypothetical protein
MKKWLIALIAFLGLAAAPAQAQSFQVGIINFGYNTFDPGEGTGLQVSVGTLFFSTDLEVNYLLGRIPLTTDNKFTFYYGAGAHAGFFGLFTFGSIGAGAHAVLGVDYLLQPNLAIGVGFNPGVTFYFTGPTGSFISPYFGGGLHLQFKI